MVNADKEGEALENQQRHEALGASAQAVDGSQSAGGTARDSVVREASGQAAASASGDVGAEKSTVQGADRPDVTEASAVSSTKDDGEAEATTTAPTKPGSSSSSAAVDGDGDAVMTDRAREKKPKSRAPKKVEDLYHSLVDHFKQAMTDEDSDEEGKALAAELFKLLYEGYRKHGSVPKNPSDLPATTTYQQQRLLTLLRALIAEKQSSLQRVEAALSDLIQAVFGSKWTLDQLLEDRVARVQVPAAPPSTAWGRPRQASTEISVNDRLSADLAAFRFDSSMYKPDDVARLKALCHADHGFPEKPRKPTDDEWTVIWGIMNGSILIRSLPRFLKRCCTMEQFQWLHHYMVIAVEGELYATLPQQSMMFDVNQTSKRLADDIRAYVVHNSWKDRDRVYAMLQAIKVVSYNKERHALHFHFFTKKEAIKWENMEIPFRNSVVKLQNPDARYREVTIHEDGSETISFKPQADGTRDDRYQVPYRFRLTNITRTTEIDKIARFLQTITNNALRIGVPVDTYGQGSEWSLVWEFFGKKASCPPALASINRILWRDHAILVLHRLGSVHAPCYKCARLGHQEAACPTPESEWINETTLVVTDSEIAALETERAVWQSPEDARAIFERLGADSPALPSPPVTPKSTTSNVTEATAALAQPTNTETRTKPVHLQTPRDQVATEWLTVMSKRSRSQQVKEAAQSQSAEGAGKPAPKTRKRNQSHRKKDRKDTQADVKDGKTDKKTDKIATKSMIELDSDTDDDEQPSQQCNQSTEDTNQTSTAAAASKPAATARPGVYAQDLRTAENSLLDNARARSNMERIGMSMTALVKRHSKPIDTSALLATLVAKIPDLDEKVSTARLLEALSAQLAKTPMTGNCQPYAITEALLQQGIKGMSDDSIPLELTMLLKFGMHLAHQVDHESELGISYIAALHDKVAADRNAIQKYFSDLAVSSSERSSILPEELWGGHDTLRMAAKLVDRRIDLIIETDDPAAVNVMQYQPQRARDQRTKALFETAVLVQPGIDGWVECIREDLANDKLPVVLHFSPKAAHYSAVLLHREATPTSEKRQTDLRNLLNPVKSIDAHIEEAKQNVTKQIHASNNDEEGPTRKMLVESQSEITTQTAMTALTQRNWTREEKKIVIECLVRDPQALKALLTFCGPSSQESEASIQCAQNTPDQSNSVATSDDSYHPSSDSDNDTDISDGLDNDEATYAFPSPREGRSYTTWVKRKWKEVQDEWAEQDAGKLPQLDDYEALHDFAIKHPDELAAAGQLFPNPFRFLDHFENEGLQDWMRPRWLHNCTKAVLDRVEQIVDPAARDEVREALRFINDSPSLAVRVRKWQQKKFWKLLKTALPSCFKGPQAVPFFSTNHVPDGGVRLRYGSFATIACQRPTQPRR